MSTSSPGKKNEMKPAGSKSQGLATGKRIARFEPSAVRDGKNNRIKQHMQMFSRPVY